MIRTKGLYHTHLVIRRRRSLRVARALACALLLGGCGSSALHTSRDVARVDSQRQEASHALAMNAKGLCSGVFVGGRDAHDVIQRDLRNDSAFGWWDGIQVDIDQLNQTVTLSAPGVPARTAVHHQGLGCTLLPEGETDVRFTPLQVKPVMPSADQLTWPMGDGADTRPLPAGVDTEALAAVLDDAFDEAAHHQGTRAMVVLHRGRIVGERYAPGFDRHSKLVGWSMGKSITSALVGVLVQQGELALDDPAPIPEWQAADDPRRHITITNLLHMSSGLDFERRPANDRTLANDHFRVYFGAIDVFALSTSKPLAFPPGTHWAYRNGDPLSLGRIIRDRVRARGEQYLTFPQRALFDRIGIHGMLLEPDPWGQFVMTGFDWGTARDWARFGLLHERDGVWMGERILPEGWTRFVATPAPADESQGYGALFWLNRGGVHPSWPRATYWAAGHLGQRVVVVPSHEVVIVRLGHSPDSRAFSDYFEWVVADLLAAIPVAVDKDDDR